MNFLRTIGETKILSNPKIACVSDQEARILVGQKQAYVTTTTTTSSGGGSTVAENVTFIDVGIQLAVTPVVNEDGFVTMKIKPEVSSVADSLETPSGNTIPIVDTSTAETTVMVRDGVSILIGGLRRDEKIEDRKKVPILGDIPILGAPFNSFTESTVHTELLILITPHIVYGNTLVTGETKAMDRLFKTYTDYSAPVDMQKVEWRKAEAVRS
jgi:type II secretory pathway component GspD/PulD (secretin)